jgi:hypothetical protein
VTTTAPRAYFALCGAVIGWSLGVLIPAYGRWPLLYYDPALRRWFVGRATSALPIGYYGLVAFGVAGALVGGLVGRLAAARARDEWFGLAAAWAVTALVVAVAYHAFQLWPHT